MHNKYPNNGAYFVRHEYFESFYEYELTKRNACEPLRFSIGICKKNRKTKIKQKKYMNNINLRNNKS